MKHRKSIQFLLLPLLASFISGCLGQSQADEDYHPGIGAPRLTFSATQADPFANIYVGGSGDVSFTVNNVGTGLAAEISATTLSAPFGFKDGTFPGTGGNCGATLAPGLSCTVTVTFSPTSGISYGQTMSLSYVNPFGGNAKQASSSLAATGATGSSGSLDLQTFGGDGILTTAVGTSSALRSIALQSDGKIVAAGSATVSGTQVFAVARYETDGDLDTTFGTGGIVTTTIGAAATPYAVVIQSDGKIIVGGTSDNDYAIARYETDGDLDTSFAGDGTFSHHVGTVDSINAIALASGGKIVAAGYAGTASAGILRLLSDGTLDTTFDTDGVVVDTTYGMVFAVAIQSDGKILVVPHNAWVGALMRVMRYSDNGSLDTSFDGDGLMESAALGLGGGYSIVLQSDDKIVVAGYKLVTPFSDSDIAIMRLNTDGSYDTSFSTDGMTTVRVGSGSEYTRRLGVALQSDGKIFIATNASNGTNIDSVLLRLNSDGSLDTSFDSDGIQIVDVGSTDALQGAAVQSDGKLVAVGFAGSTFNVIRLWP